MGSDVGFLANLLANSLEEEEFLEEGILKEAQWTTSLICNFAMTQIQTAQVPNV